MSHKEIKERFVFQDKLNGAECYLQTTGSDKQLKRPYYTYWMISEKTGTHCINSNSNRMDERVQAHWAGFKMNQNR